MLFMLSWLSSVSSYLWHYVRVLLSAKFLPLMYVMFSLTGFDIRGLSNSVGGLPCMLGAIRPAVPNTWSLHDVQTLPFSGIHAAFMHLVHAVGPRTLPATVTSADRGRYSHTNEKCPRTGSEPRSPWHRRVRGHKKRDPAGGHRAIN